jgi:hypothetical protein
MEKNLELALTQSIRKSDTEEIFIEPVCNFFGIHLKNQIERIKRDRICQSDVRKNSCQAMFGDNKQRNCMGKRGFIRWIQIINAEIVRPELQTLFIQYQVAVFDYLYNGNEQKTAQLEDIRTFALNINKAVRINHQVMEYIAEQKQHRDLCLSSSPSDWAQIKPNLFQVKQLPEGPMPLKAIGLELPNDIDQLKIMKKNLQTSISKANSMLQFRVEYSGKDENPMPEGYKKEMIKLRIKGYEEQLEKVDQKLIEIINR